MIAHTLADRIVLFCTRATAVVMLFAGLALFTAGMALASLLGDSPVARTLSGLGFQVAAALVLSAGLASLLSREQGIPLPNELRLGQRDERQGAEAASALGGWLAGVALTCVAVPVWLVFSLQPLLAEWRDLLPVLTDARLWEGANSNGSGLILLPIFAALTPPLLEVVTLAAIGAASAALLVLLLRRSVAFPRLYLVITLLLVGLIIATHRSAAGALLAAAEVRRLIDGSGSPQELAVALDALTRYTAVVSAGAAALPWAGVGYVIWAPLLVATGRARTTFAPATADRTPSTLDTTTVAAITKPPRFPG